VYHSPLNVETRAEVRKQFAALAGADVTDGAKVSAWGRAIHVPQSGAGVAWFEFADLCGSKRPLSAADYLEITKAFHTVFVTEVPKMDLGSKDMVRFCPNKVVWKTDNVLQARRLITFVDACYESKATCCHSTPCPHTYCVRRRSSS
jgi:protein AFG1